jgi:hypothetical protein
MTVWESDNRHPQQSPYSHPRLAELIFALDKLLRQRNGVLEYSSHRSCIFRIEICSSRRNLTLRDGTRLSAGDRIARLHYWNEQVPARHLYTSQMLWAREFHRRIAISLTELARYLRAQSDLADVNVVCGDVASAVSEQSGQIAHIMRRYGFEAILVPEPLLLRERLIRLGENILISLIVLAQNADALRVDSLRRTRVPIYISRQTLEQKFGSIGRRATGAGESS